MDDCFDYGHNPSLLRARYLEAHDLIIRAWTERETFAFNGRYNQQRYVNIWPRPLQHPHPPVMPKLAPLFAGWEDRWWPQPMDTADRARLPAFTPRRPPAGLCTPA